MQIPMSYEFREDRSSIGLVEQALTDLKVRLEKDSLKAHRMSRDRKRKCLDKDSLKMEKRSRKKGNYGLTEPIKEFTRNVLRVAKFLRAAEFRVIFESGRTFKFFAVESEGDKRQVERKFRDEEKGWSPLIIVIRGNEYIPTLVHRIGNHIRTFFASIKRKFINKRRRLRLRREHVFIQSLVHC